MKFYNVEDSICQFCGRKFKKRKNKVTHGGINCASFRNSNSVTCSKKCSRDLAYKKMLERQKKYKKK